MNNVNSLSPGLLLTPIHIAVLVISFSWAIRGPLHCSSVSLTVLPPTSLLPSDLYSNATFSVDFPLYTLHKITILILQHSLASLCIIICNTYHVVFCLNLFLESPLYHYKLYQVKNFVKDFYLFIFNFIYLFYFWLCWVCVCMDFSLTALPMTLFSWLKYLLTWV